MLVEIAPNQIKLNRWYLLEDRKVPLLSHGQDNVVNVPILLCQMPMTKPCQGFLRCFLEVRVDQEGLGIKCGSSSVLFDCSPKLDLEYFSTCLGFVV